MRMTDNEIPYFVWGNLTVCPPYEVQVSIDMSLHHRLSITPNYLPTHPVRNSSTPIGKD